MEEPVRLVEDQNETFMEVYDSQCNKRNLILSEYAQNLDSLLQTQYIAKLIVEIGGENLYLPDPYSLPLETWREDMNLWPKMKNSDMNKFLATCPGESYNSLTAYEHVLAEEVQNVVACVPESPSNLVLMQATVKSSEETSVTSYVPWILCQNDGEIKTSHCDCLAGMTDVCNHIAALLFHILSGDLLKVDASKGSAQNRKRKKHVKEKVISVPLSQINFQSAKSARQVNSVAPVSAGPLTPKEIAALRKIAPNAVFFTSFCDESSTDTASGDEDEMS